MNSAGSSEESLLTKLKFWAEEHPLQKAFTFHQLPSVSFGELWSGILGWAARLQKTGLRPEERVLIAVPNSPQFFFLFYGVLLAGGVAVPVFPGSGIERIFKFSQLCDASFLCASDSFSPSKIGDLKSLSKKAGRRFVVVDQSNGGNIPESTPAIDPSKNALIQFTSGSSGEPKAVMITHDRLMINIRQMIEGFEITSKDRFVSWLPVFHDMGLILMTMVPLYLGSEFHQLPSSIHYLSSWLKTIEAVGGTFTAAPDFAYRMCLAHIPDKERYDLTSLRVALNAAEPVRRQTIRRFEDAFHLKNVICPAYGLAEATVGVAGWKPGIKVRADSQGFVSVGRPFSGIRCRIEAPIKNEQGPGNDKYGEICLKGPANTTGYFQNPEATKSLFTRDGYLKTGDLGYLDGKGNLYVVGRKKNIIIHGGFTISSREIEEWADELPYVRRSAAVGIDRGGTAGEQAFLFCEVRLHTRPELQKKAAETTIRSIIGGFHETFGFRPGRVYLLKPRSIPMTANGKIQYAHLKKMYLEGALQKLDLILFPDY